MSDNKDGRTETSGGQNPPVGTGNVSPSCGDSPELLSPAVPEGASSPFSVEPKPKDAPKQSGLKQPSKIGRLCSGQAKPALPPSPMCDSGHDSKRDDYRRQKLTDVEETDENESEFKDKLPDTPTPRKTRNYSVSSNASMDTLWDLHPRRLSEAGLRRHSDTSVVLTEDTDCFIIGMKVWVGGTKPGQIAYLGETQFAPGEWAGIVLDEPIGKNDGSVSGIRYFQCEPKRGVFSRLTRLTLAPLPEAAAMIEAARATPVNGARRSVSPAGSTRSIQRPSSALNTSTTSLSSAQYDFKVGDRVIVKSTQGSKLGTLRYVGATEFANGEWCGVELDDPLGKNDGSVEGKRYFECAARYGLFAPAAKVSKSPSSRRPSQCAVHRGAAAPGLRRAGSKESMASLTSVTSAASAVRRVRLGVTSLTPKRPPATTPPSKNPLQDVLCEKERHIDQLLKERELEQAEMVRLIGRTEDFQKKLRTVQDEYDRFRNDCEKKYQEYQSSLGQLQKEKKELMNHLDEEKKKLEDIQFRYEEEVLNKDDIEDARKTQSAHIKKLEESLKIERERNAELAKQASKYLQTQEKLLKAENELNELKVEVISRSKRSADDGGLVAKLQEELRQVKSTVLQKDAEIAENMRLMRDLEEDHGHLRTEKEHAGEERRREQEEFKRYREEQAALAANLTEAVHKHESEASAKSLEVARRDQKVRLLEEQVAALQEDLTTARGVIESRCLDIDKVNDEQRAKLAERLEAAQTRLNDTEQRLLTARQQVTTRAAEHELQERRLRIELSSAAFEQRRLRAALNASRAECGAGAEHRGRRHRRQVLERQAEIDSLQHSFRVKADELNVCEDLNAHLENEICSKNAALEQLKARLEADAKVISEQRAYIEQLTVQLHAELGDGDMSHRLQQSAQKVAELEYMVEQLRAQLQAVQDIPEQHTLYLNEELRKLEQAMTAARIDLNARLEAAARVQQQLQAELEHAREQFRLERQRLEQELRLAAAREEQLRGGCDAHASEAARVQALLRQQAADLGELAERHKREGRARAEEALAQAADLQQKLTLALAYQQQMTDDFNAKIAQLDGEVTHMHDLVRQKTELLAAAERDLAAVQSQVERHVGDSHANELERARLTAEVEQHRRSIADLQAHILTNEQTAQQLRDANAELQLKIQQQEREIAELSQLKSGCEQRCEGTRRDADRLSAQLAELQEERRRLTAAAAQADERLATLSVELRDAEAQRAGAEHLAQEQQALVATLRVDVHDLRAEKEAAAAVLEERERRIVALAAQLEQTQRDRGSASAQFARQEQQLVELNVQLQRLRDEAREDSARHDELRARCQRQEVLAEDAERRAHDADEAASRLREQLTALEHERAALEDAAHQAERQLVEVRAHLHEEVAGCEQRAQAAAAELQRAVRDQQEALDGQGQEAQQKDERIAELTLQVQQLSDQTAHMEKTWHGAEDEWKVRLHQLEAMKDAAASQNGALQQQLVQLQVQLHKLQSVEAELDGERKKYEEIYQQLAVSQEQHASLLQKLHELDEPRECQPIVQIVEQLQQTTTPVPMDQFKAKVAADREAVQLALEDTKAQLAEKDRQLLLQQTECAKLQKQVLNIKTQVIEVPVPVPGPVQFVGCPDTPTPAITAAYTVTEPYTTPRVTPPKEQDLPYRNTDPTPSTDYTDQATSRVPFTETRAPPAPRPTPFWPLTTDAFAPQTTLHGGYNDLAQPQVTTAPAGPTYYYTQTPVVTDQEYEAVGTGMYQNMAAHDTVVPSMMTTALPRQPPAQLSMHPDFRHKRIKPYNIIASHSMPTFNTRLFKIQDKGVCSNEEFQKLVKENEFTKGQVVFLNNIIVDMHRKNEELMYKVEILEGSSHTSVSKQVEFKGVRLNAPRVYCDICEVFDAHETEDCPVQTGGGGGNGQHSHHHPSNKNKTKTRLYCDLCEVFGHDTADCDNHETY